jgi:Flp pilus assembly protein CpaB
VDPTGATNTGKQPKAPKAPKAPRIKKAGSGRRTVAFAIAGACGVLATAGAFSVINGATGETVTVYRTTGPVAANSAAASNMFTATEVPASSVEGGTIIPADQLNGMTWYAEEDLVAGAMATDANFNRSTRIDVTELADPNLMAQTFTAEVEDAVGGRLRAGDYVSILKTSAAGSEVVTADFVLRSVLLLDVSTIPSDESSANNSGIIGGSSDANINARYTGVPQLYTVALDAEQTRALTAAKNGRLTVVLTRVDATPVAATTPRPAAPTNPQPVQPGTVVTPAPGDVPPVPVSTDPAVPAVANQ